MPREHPAEPWRSFLTDLDSALAEPADFHCIGGFVVSQHYGFARETADLDVLTVTPSAAAHSVAHLAGKGSPLHALTKLERSSDRDIRDVIFLAQAGLIQRTTLLSRFEKELEPYIVSRTPTWNRSTLQMWLDACWPDAKNPARTQLPSASK